MITISRALAKRLVSLFGKTLGLKPYSLSRQAVIFRVAQKGLTIESATATHAVRYCDPSYAGMHQEWEAPLVALQTLAKSKASSGEFYLHGEGEVGLHLVEKSIPREEGFSMPDVVLSMPAAPENGYLLPLTARNALIAAFETTDPEPIGRYALSRVQFKGSNGSLIATDGRQALIQTGLNWGFEEDLLLANYRKLFASGDFPEEPLELGKTESHLVFRSGHWEFFLPIEQSQIYPRVEDVVPSDDQAIATLEVSHGDANYLREVLPLLPFDVMDHERPVTIELNGKIGVRASSIKNPAGIEVVLRSSQRCGVDLLCAMQRGYLQKALDLGLRRFQFFDGGNSPVVVRQGDVTYCWAAYHENAVVTGTPDTEVRESPIKEALATKSTTKPTKKGNRKHAAEIVGGALPGADTSRKRGRECELPIGSRIIQRSAYQRGGVAAKAGGDRF